jgi:hypothetical protein
VLFVLCFLNFSLLSAMYAMTFWPAKKRPSISYKEVVISLAVQ